MSFLENCFTNTQQELLSLFSINLEQIEHQFALKARPFIMHGNSVPDHVISELYQVPENIRLEYLMLLQLQTLQGILLDYYPIQSSSLLFVSAESLRHRLMVGASVILLRLR